MSDVSSVALRSGERMSVSIVEPPLTEYARRSPEGRLVNWLWGDIKDEVISGEMRPWLYTPYAVGEIGPELVGSLAYYTSTYNQEVGLIQFVETDEGAPVEGDHVGADVGADREVQHRGRPRADAVHGQPDRGVAVRKARLLVHDRGRVEVPGSGRGRLRGELLRAPRRGARPRGDICGPVLCGSALQSPRSRTGS